MKRLSRRCGERGIEFNPRAAQSTSTNAAGGALVPQQFADTVIRLVEDYGVVRQAAQVFPMTSDSAVVPVRETGLTATYTAEGAAIDASDASWSNVTLSPKKLGTLVKFSTELSEDALGVVSDMLALECGTAFALTEDTSCLIGDGTSPYGGMTGILTKCLDGTHDMSIVEATSTHDTLGEVTVGGHREADGCGADLREKQCRVLRQPHGAESGFRCDQSKRRRNGSQPAAECRDAAIPGLSDFRLAANARRCIG